MVTSTVPWCSVSSPRSRSPQRGQDPDVGGVPRGGGPVRVVAVHQRHRVGQVQLVDDVRDALVQVDRALVDRRVRRPRVDRAEHPAGGRLDHPHRLAAGAPDVEVRSTPRRPVPTGGPVPEQASPDEVRQHSPCGLAAEQRQVVLGERELRRGAAQLRPEHVRILRVEHRRLDRSAEDRIRVVDKVGVQRVVASHEHHERTQPFAAGPAGLLPQRRQRAGEAGQHHGVQTGDVDAEFKRVGRGDAEQRPVRERGLQSAALLRQVARPVRGDPAGELGRDARQVPPGGEREHLRSAPGPDEGQRASVLDDQVGEQPGGLGAGRAPHRRSVLAARLGQRRLPQRERRRAAGRRVVGDLLHLQPGEPAAGDRRTGHRRRGEHEGRIGPVRGADPAQPAQHVRDVRAEDAAVGVALVDHDVLQPAQERRPPRVRRQDSAVQHVRVRQHEPGVRPNPVPLRRLGVAVEGRGADVRQHQRAERPQLVGRERLGRRQVERGRLAVGEQRREAPGAGRPATCRTRCRSRSPPTCRSGRATRLRPGAPTDARSPGPRSGRPAGQAPSPASPRAVRGGAGPARHGSPGRACCRPGPARADRARGGRRTSGARVRTTSVTLARAGLVRSGASSGARSADRRLSHVANLRGGAPWTSR